MAICGAKGVVLLLQHFVRPLILVPVAFPTKGSSPVAGWPSRAPPTICASYGEVGQTPIKPILNEECVRVDAAKVFACYANAKGKADFLDCRRLFRAEHARIQVEETANSPSKVTKFVFKEQTGRHRATGGIVRQ